MLLLANSSLLLQAIRTTLEAGNVAATIHESSLQNKMHVSAIVEARQQDNLSGLKIRSYNYTSHC